MNNLPFVRGVIIGWDSHTKAPTSWIRENHEGNEQWSSQPNYAVLVRLGAGTKTNTLL